MRHLTEMLGKLFTSALSFVPGANIPRDIRKRRKKYAPKPLPSRRPRTLSLSDEGNKASFLNIQSQGQKTSTKKQYACAQKQSLLLGSLPLEIRQRIWKYLLGSFDLHLVRDKRKLVAIQCHGEEKERRCPPCEHSCWGYSDKAFPGYHGVCPGYLLGTDNCPLFPDPIPLLQTCRMVYSEAIPILYRENAFYFNHVDTILNLSQTIIPSRLNLLCTIHFVYAFPHLTFGDRKRAKQIPPYDFATWEEVCLILATISSLRELYMHIGGSALLQDQIHEVLDPLRQIQQTSIFEVYVGARKNPAELYQVKDVPFKFVSLDMDTSKKWFCCK